MKKIYKRILSLGLAVGVIFSLQESVHICAQENTQTTESIFADYGDENGGETDTAEQIKTRNRQLRRQKPGKIRSRQPRRRKPGKIRSRQLRQRPGKSWMLMIQKKRKKVSG